MLGELAAKTQRDADTVCRVWEAFSRLPDRPTGPRGRTIISTQATAETAAQRNDLIVALAQQVGG